MKAILVFGHGAKGARSLSPVAVKRLEAALIHYRMARMFGQRAKIYLLAGVQMLDKRTMSARLAAVLRNIHHVPREDIVMEQDAFTTAQEIASFASHVKADGDVTSVVMVTSKYHMPRVKYIAKRLAPELDPDYVTCSARDAKGLICEPLAWVKVILLPNCGVKLSIRR